MNDESDLELLHGACESGDVAMVAAMHADPEGPSLNEWGTRRTFSLVRLHVSCKAARRDPAAGKDGEGQSALHHACLGGHLDTVRYVTDNGAPSACNERDKNDMTPFHLACEGGFLEVVATKPYVEQTHVWSLTPPVPSPRKFLAAHPRLDRGLRATTKTSYFLASRHGFAEICALLTALEEAENPGGVPEAPRRKPGMIPAKKRAAAVASDGGSENTVGHVGHMQAGEGKRGQSHGKKMAKGSSSTCVVS